MAWQSHPAASAGDRSQGSNERPTVVDGLWCLHTGQYMLYFACHTEPVPLTERLRGTRTPEQKKKRCNGAVCLGQRLADSGMEPTDHVPLPCVLHCSPGAFARSVGRLPECPTIFHLR